MKSSRGEILKDFAELDNMHGSIFINSKSSGLESN
jgi:hypothetical protein